jgi:hypothetical protein
MGDDIRTTRRSTEIGVAAVVHDQRQFVLVAIAALPLWGKRPRWEQSFLHKPSNIGAYVM